MNLALGYLVMLGWALLAGLVAVGSRALYEYSTVVRARRRSARRRGFVTR